MGSDTIDHAETSDLSKRAADHVFGAIQSDIQTGALKNGETLPSERELMKRFDVSRTVVREAIGILSSRGLVEARPRYRPVVKKPGIDTAMKAVEGIVGTLLSQPGGVKNLFETRTLIEVGLVREAAVSATKEEIGALKSALERNKEAVHHSERFFETDVAFHKVLYDVTHNPVMPAIHTAYTSWLAPQWSKMPRSPERNQRNYEAHEAIFQAILMRDPDAAEQALKSHLTAAWEQVRQTFGEQ